MKLAAIILAASAMGPAQLHPPEPSQVPWGEMALGQVARCDDEAGCVVFSREALAQVLQAVRADAIANAPCRRTPSI